MPRKILVLLDQEGPRAPLENVVYAGAQMVLNYYGMLVEYRNVNTGPLPDDGSMTGFRGVITAFTEGRIGEPKAYLSWLLRQMEAGRKVIVLGPLGVQPYGHADPEIPRLVNAVYAGLGLRYEGDHTAVKPLLRYVHKEPGGVEFERAYPAYPPVYERYVPTGKDLCVFLSLRRTDRADSESAVIVTGPQGGLALSRYILFEDPITHKRQWYLNPFRFFREALNLKGIPAPDPTTLNGVRVALSHVDGDAFSGQSRIEKRPLCAEVLRDEVLRKFDFPVTVSVITGEVSPQALGNETLVDLAREIFALPNVEPASHSFSHPFYWSPDYAGKGEYHRLHAIEIPGYTFDPAVEIDGSVAYINDHLAPPDKPCRVFLWTGNCEPRPSDVARCDRLGLLNMNGGDTVFDDTSDSYTAVAPLVRNVGGHIQVHTGQANENVLTNLWEGPFHGYRNIITTMKRTGSPRRVAPIDIYYHFYSAEYPASLKALQDVYAWVLEQETARLFTSEYLERVQGYLSTEIHASGPDQYEIHNYGACTTIRFEDASLGVDLAGSENVLGWVSEPQGLFVSLVPNRDRAVVQTVKGEADRGPDTPFLQKATGWVDRMESGDGQLELSYRGFGKGDIAVAGLTPNRACTVSGSALEGRTSEEETDSKGVLTLSSVVSGNIKVVW
mgnify:FL=1